VAGGAKHRAIWPSEVAASRSILSFESASAVRSTIPPDLQDTDLDPPAWFFPLTIAQRPLLWHVNPVTPNTSLVSLTGNGGRAYNMPVHCQRTRAGSRRARRFDEVRTH
jgi:hypothetical protein